VPQRPRCPLHHDLPLPPREPPLQCFNIHEVHYGTTHQSNASTRLRNQKCTTTSTTKEKIQDDRVRMQRVGPPAGLLPLLRWAQGPPLVSYRPGAPRTSLKRRQIARCVATGCHVSLGSGHGLLDEVGFGAAACPAAPDPASL
jgi:hypothetical protein